MLSMTTQMVKFKNGVIALPLELKKSWEGANVFMNADEASIIIKKVQTPTLEELEPVLREMGKEITLQDIDDAVREVRAGQRQ